MRILVLIAISSVVFAAGCGGTEPANNANAKPTNAGNTAPSNVNNPLAATTPTPASTLNAAPTLLPVFKAYCAAMEKKDEAAIRKVYAAETLADFEKVMKEDGLKSLNELLSTDQVTTALCEIRNEVITGDTAVAEVKTAGMPNGGKIVFVKEGGEWKLTNRVPGFEKK